MKTEDARCNIWNAAFQEVDQETTPEQIIAAMEHAEYCADCRADFENDARSAQLTRVWDESAATPEPASPSRMWRVLKHVAAGATLFMLFVLCNAFVVSYVSPASAVDPVAEIHDGSAIREIVRAAQQPKSRELDTFERSAAQALAQCAMNEIACHIGDGTEIYQELMHEADKLSQQKISPGGKAKVIMILMHLGLHTGQRDLVASCASSLSRAEATIPADARAYYQYLRKRADREYRPKDPASCANDNAECNYWGAFQSRDQLSAVFAEEVEIGRIIKSLESETLPSASPVDSMRELVSTASKANAREKLAELVSQADKLRVSSLALYDRAKIFLLTSHLYLLAENVPAAKAAFLRAANETPLLEEARVYAQYLRLSCGLTSQSDHRVVTCGKNGVACTFFAGFDSPAKLLDEAEALRVQTVVAQTKVELLDYSGTGRGGQRSTTKAADAVRPRIVERGIAVGGITSAGEVAEYDGCWGDTSIYFKTTVDEKVRTELNRRLRDALAPVTVGQTVEFGKIMTAAVRNRFDKADVVIVLGLPGENCPGKKSSADNAEEPAKHEPQP